MVTVLVPLALLGQQVYAQKAELWVWPRIVLLPEFLLGLVYEFVPL